MLETNIDDMNPETYSYIMPRLFENGALDVYYTSIMMKKNRPGTMLSVLCTKDNSNALENIIFKETSTFGIRKYTLQRQKLNRKFINVQTKYGNISVKVGYQDGKVIKYSPEYEDCKKLANEHNVPIKNIYDEAIIKFNV